MAVQWLGLSASTAPGPGLIPGRWGTKIPEATRSGQKKKIIKIKINKRFGYSLKKKVSREFILCIISIDPLKPIIASLRNLESVYIKYPETTFVRNTWNVVSSSTFLSSSRDLQHQYFSTGESLFFTCDPKIFMLIRISKLLLKLLVLNP